MDERELGLKMSRDIKGGTDVSSIVFVQLAQTKQFDDVTITEHADLFALWDRNMAVSALKAGLIVQDEGLLYRLIHTLQDASQNGKPKDTPSVWARIGNPAEEWPKWVPWVGGMDLYMSGAKVTHSGKRWVSAVDSNVWEPGVYGWNEAG